ncbi:hypothetical protein [Desulfosporosinus metallidurans]|uniref:Uncharacterized protein n=1 Tax=Desulfosporosinus metallidurans TaxID=1888891 RepID=A0A1Q8QQ71_9FIRM|nr:hypothetical protein DSOL_3514 [Desulfosporosinus metallidurans]
MMGGWGYGPGIGVIMAQEEMVMDGGESLAWRCNSFFESRSSFWESIYSGVTAQQLG